MKKFTILMSLILAMVITGSAFALGSQNIFNPMEFTGTEAQKTEVIAGIQRNVYNTYCVEGDMCSESTLRMMEKAELTAFKYLTQIESNMDLYNGVVQTYCVDIDMCDYSTIAMMYDSEVKASKETLTF